MWKQKNKTIGTRLGCLVLCFDHILQDSFSPFAKRTNEWTVSVKKKDIEEVE